MSFKMDMICDLPELKLGVFPVRHSTLKPLNIKQKINIVRKQNSFDGLDVEYKTIIDGKKTKTNKAWINSNGEIISKQEVKTYIINKDGTPLLNEDGTPQEIEEYKMTKSFQILKFVDISFKDELLCGKPPVEIFRHTDKDKPEIEKFSIKKLLELANYLKENNKGAIGKFTFGRGFSMYLAFLTPKFIENEFLKINNEKFGYRRFDYLYLEDSASMDNNLGLFKKKVETFFISD